MDIMNPIMDNLDFTSLISPLTLAYFKDSGWYDVQLSRMSYPDSWGRGAGCDFVEKPCITPDGISLNNSQFFCDTQGNFEVEDGCNDDLTQKAVCDGLDYNEELPPEYKYFDNNFGGRDPYLDYCPTYKVKSINSCVDSGVNSRCVTGEKNGVKKSSCLPIACTMDKRELSVKSDGKWEKCASMGQRISSKYDVDNYVVCPEPRRVCPTFYCPNNCFGADVVGVCDYKGDCMCSGILCAIQVVDFNALDVSVKDYYFRNDDSLVDDTQDILQQTLLMFHHMTVGDVIGFVACSLVAVMMGVVVILFLIRMIRPDKNGNLRLQKICGFQLFWHKSEWTVSAMQSSANDNSNVNVNRNRNKEKMVASVLVDMRIHHNDIMDVDQEIKSTGMHATCVEKGTLGTKKKSNVVTSHRSERTFIRSELPALPNPGRIVFIPGSKFIDDSPLQLEDNEYLSNLEGTAVATSFERSTNLDSSSIANKCDSITDSPHNGTNLDDDLYTPKMDRPRRRRLFTQFLSGKF
eukprot:CAMPEP_0198274126 /NCGR_PEP_ID=MMETSP1447-20131203/59181_1 /TAXON_ID=420782 /ORGANISM="Chaetoceros dichaeta, Strain CCMP1751" /LENGTH=518 /DNA_ID=CAMNT_0043968121 /DNA_START=64 /DNA_END=1620 /DNA_ORIENTATION=+